MSRLKDGELARWARRLARCGWQLKSAAMPQYRFQVRTGDATISHGTAIEFDDLAQALSVAKMTMTGLTTRAADATVRLVGSVLEIVDGAGDVVASLPIGEAILRH